MSTFQSLLQSIRQVKTLEQCAYIMGYVNAEYAHDFVTPSEYKILTDYIQAKRSVINA